jgi:hypothetical protein
LSCSQSIGFASWEVDTYELTDRLYIYTCCSIDDLTKVSHILEEEVSIGQAVHRCIGEVFILEVPRGIIN